MTSSAAAKYLAQQYGVLLGVIDSGTLTEKFFLAFLECFMLEPDLRRFCRFGYSKMLILWAMMKKQWFYEGNHLREDFRNLHQNEHYLILHDALYLLFNNFNRDA